MNHRAFNTSYISNDSFIKLSSEPRLADEIFYYQQIQSLPQKNSFAEFKNNLSNGLIYALEIKDYSNDYCNYFEFLNKEKSFDKIEKSLHRILDELIYIHAAKPPKLLSSGLEIDFKQINKSMLIDKTESEFNKLALNDDFMAQLINFESLVINGKSYSNFNAIWPQIKQIIIDKYLDFDLTLIHGDFCFANILINDKLDLKLIDPRGSYCLKGIYGDPAYDYAKLLHSASGDYEYIVYDKYQLDYNQNIINYKFDIDFKIDLKSFLRKDKLEKAELIQGLLFISMCSRHYDSLEHQIIMYCQGIKILNNWL